VRGFEAGVYHHFVVKGPRQLSIRIFRNLSMNVLLQGIFMDRLDTRTDAMATAATHGPWGELLGRQQPRMGASPSCDFCDATTRRDTVRGLLQRPIEGLLGEWWTYRLLNDYGAGRGYERQALGRVCDTVRSALGAEASAEMWQATSAAQREAGKRASAVLFTRLALDEWRRLDSDLPTRLARLESAIRVMQSDWRYYFGYPGNAKPFETLYPLDEAYSRELADQLIAQARADRTPMQAAADILPLARDLCAQGRELLPCVLFAAVGADNLGSSDLLLYAKAERDPQARLKLTRMAQALNPSTTRSSLSPIDIMLRLARGGDLDGAEAELVRVLADPDVLRFTKANAAYNFAYHLMQIGERTGAAGDRERSIKWFKVVIDQFGDTHFAATAKKCIDRQNQAQ